MSEAIEVRWGPEQWSKFIDMVREEGRAAGLAEGRQWAINTLRDDDRWLTFMANPDNDEVLYDAENALAARYLEAMAGATDG